MVSDNSWGELQTLKLKRGDRLGKFSFLVVKKIVKKGSKNRAKKKRGDKDEKIVQKMTTTIGRLCSKNSKMVLSNRIFGVVSVCLCEGIDGQVGGYSFCEKKNSIEHME